MARSLHSIIKCFALTTDDSYLSSEALEGSSCQIDVNSCDCIVICTDGIRDLLPSHKWQPISDETDLQD